MSQIEIQVLCQYTLLPNGVHELVLLYNTRAAFDEFVVHLRKVYDAHTPEAPMRFLVDFRPTFPPLSYAFQRGVKLFTDYPQHNANYAFLVTRSPLATLSQTFFGMLPIRRPGRFFKEDEYDEAVEWLLTQ